MKGQGSGSGPVGGSERITDLDESSLLAALGDTAQVIRQDEVDQLLLVSEWAVSHPGLGATGVLDADEHPGAEGTPAVAAFTAEPLAVALKISPRQAQSFIAETLDLKHRLPRVWDQVIALMCPVWKARRIARRTHHLPLAAMPYVDGEVNGAVMRIGIDHKILILIRNCKS